MQLLRMRPEKVQKLKSVRGLSELSRMIITKRSGV
jgi:hypothetical protein